MLLADHLEKVPLSWSPDGRFILYRVVDGGRNQLSVLPLGGDGKPFPLLKGTHTEFQGQFSPDGRWIAYALRPQSSTAPFEVYVTPFPGPGGTWQLSSDGAALVESVRWRRDGK